MRKTDQNLGILRTLFVVSLVISNVVTGKLFHTGIELFGVTITLPGAVVCYAITFLMTDVIGELWGKKEASKTVMYGFIGQVTATLLIILTRYIPAVDGAMQEAYVRLLGQNYVFVIGSMVAYYVSQSCDVFIFHKVRDRYMERHGSNRHRWIWNNLSTCASQMVDTVLFTSVSFGLGFGWFFDKAMWTTLAAMMVGQYVYKFLLALMDTPFFYVLARHEEQAG